MEPKKLTRPLAEFRKPTGLLLNTNRAARRGLASAARNQIFFR